MTFRGIEKWVSKLGNAPRQRQEMTVTELREFDCACAVMDLPYVLRYEHGASGKLKLLESIKGSGAVQVDRNPVARSNSFMEEKFEELVFPCPWCGVTGLIQCGACRHLVCMGRMHEKVFHCRGSCGAYGIPVPLTGLSGQSRSGGTRSSTPAPNPSTQALPSRAGTSLAKKS